MPHRAVSIAGALSLAFIIGSCGDAPTNDHRGFTKAPLETLSVFITAEQSSEMRAFARFNLPDGQPIAVADSAAADGS